MKKIYLLTLLIVYTSTYLNFMSTKEIIPIGKNIRLIRNKLGYSQEFIADSLGISKQRYRQLENEDQESLTIGRILAIASILRTDFDTLINLYRVDFISKRFENTNSDEKLNLLIELVQSQKEIILTLKNSMKAYTTEKG